jgi:hypothetical protein
MANLPKRKDSIYEEIEKFENYELTPCIAYEMAIRNQEVIDLLHDINRLDKFKDEAMFRKVSNDEEFLRSMTYSKMIEKDHKKFLDEIENNSDISMLHISRLQEILEKKLIENYLIYPKGYYRKIIGMSEPLGERVENEPDNELGNYHDDGINSSRRVYDCQATFKNDHLRQIKMTSLV